MTFRAIQKISLAGIGMDSMDAKGQIQLPTKYGGRGFRSRAPYHIQLRLHDMTPIESPIKDVLPVSVSIIEAHTAGSDDYKSLLAQYHYLGFKTTVGENIKYMVYSVHMSVAGLSE